MSFSDYYEKRLLDFIFRGIGFLLPSLYIGLARDVTDADSGATIDEVSDLFYDRIAIVASFASAVNGRTWNVVPITFPGAAASWGDVTHFVFFDSLTEGEGNVFMYGAFTDPITVLDEPLTFATGSLVAGID